VKWTPKSHLRKDLRLSASGCLTLFVRRQIERGKTVRFFGRRNLLTDCILGRTAKMDRQRGTAIALADAGSECGRTVRIAEAENH
jgi:hypothetical protein